jgi:hypothetical protein
MNATRASESLMNINLRRAATLTYLATVLFSIAASMAPIAAAQSVSRAAPDSAELSLARAVGERLRRERGAFVVFPTFLAADGNPTEGSIEDYARRSILLDAFRKGAHTQYADTVAYMDDRRRPKLPDAERFSLTLAADPSIQGDTATVDVLLENLPKTVGAIQRNLFRYWFVRTGGQWEFLRRTLLYAT